MYVKLTRYGWDSMNSGSGKVFIVGERKISPTGTIEMALIETSSAIDSWSYTESTNPDPAPNTTLPDPRYVPQLTGLTFTTSADTYDLLSDGSVIPYGLLGWTAATSWAVLDGGRIEVLWKRAQEISWQTIKLTPSDTSAKLAPLSGGETVNIQVFVYNGAGSRSAVFPATYVCSTALPVSNGVASSSGNLLADASFAGGVGQWIKGSDAGMSDSTMWRKESEYPVSGSPTNAFLYQYGMQSKALFSTSPKMPVIAGVRYACYAKAMAIRAPAYVSIVWYDVAGAVVGISYSDTTPATSTGVPGSESGYVQVGVTVAAPAGSSSAAMRLVKAGTTSGIDSGVFWLKPFFGPVDANQIGFPTWNAGGSPSVGSDQLEPESATQIWQAEFVPDSTNGAAWYGSSSRVCVVNFIPKYSGIAEVSGQVTVTHRNGVGPATYVDWTFSAIGPAPAGIKDVGGKLGSSGGAASTPNFSLLYNGGSNLSVPAIASQNGTKTVWLEANVTYSIGITVTNDGEFTINSTYPNSIDYAHLRVTQIKR